MDTQMIVLIVSIIVGLLSCFMGYRLHKIIIAIIGFYLGYQLGQEFLPDLFTDDVVVTFGSIVIGIIIGIVSFSLYLLGIFVLCFMFAYYICDGFIEVEMVKVIIGVIAGVIVGVIGVKFLRPIVIVLTSLVGGFLVIRTGMDLLNFSNNTIYVVAGLILAVLGALTQFRNHEDA